ncbi:hypothetical protein [Roseateles sp.]|uniref:hypothetical protein n=1 Tax=Roseateles sp. TaxID=1971397 RepID=UPI003BA5F87F
MNFTGQATLPVSQAQAWAALTDDPALQQASLSGCESLKRTGTHAFEALTRH